MNLLVLPFSVTCSEGRAVSGGSSGCIVVSCTDQSSSSIKSMFSTTPKGLLRHLSAKEASSVGFSSQYFEVVFCCSLQTINIDGIKRTCLAQQGLV